MPVFFDSHAHLDDPQLYLRVGALLDRCAEANVTRILCVATTAESSRTCVELAEQHDTIVAAVGIHPNHWHQSGPDDWEEIRALARHPRVAALGETGLDGFWKDCPLEQQQEGFARHWELSAETGLPLVIHMRDCPMAMRGALDDFAQRGPLRGIMHSFSGDEPLALHCLALGLHISFSGMLTYKNNERLRQIAARLPLDRLLVETDAPYLSPHPHRAVRPNEPAMVVHTATCLATLRPEPPETVFDRLFHNAAELLLRQTADPMDSMIR